ncbi:hypothetical protein [Pandoraea faecigallinarum]|uniref:hypothetical protein n=1 Tax=Pandoraea faecigallinarum TaxID=656179 RepID=UPI000A984459|nr:hypothetical protein [Pandoraea faecigallinarum]
MSELLMAEFTLRDELGKFSLPTGDACTSFVPSVVEHAQYAAQYVAAMGIG